MKKLLIATLALLIAAPALAIEWRGKDPDYAHQEWNWNGDATMTWDERFCSIGTIGVTFSTPQTAPTVTITITNNRTGAAKVWTITPAGAVTTVEFIPGNSEGPAIMHGDTIRWQSSAGTGVRFVTYIRR